MLKIIIEHLTGQQTSDGANALRAAVLGSNDGLVSNLGLVMGVAGFSQSNDPTLVAGLAGIIAGACSMAMGEWVSVKSSIEVYEKDLANLRGEFERHPEKKRLELVRNFSARGFTHEAANEAADRQMADPESAIRSLAQYEMNVDPDELGSPWTAALASFLVFPAGAVIPIVPFFFIANHHTSVLISAGLSTVALFSIGAGITLLTGRSWLQSGLRQVAFGLAAAAVTYGVGQALGVAIG